MLRRHLLAAILAAATAGSAGAPSAAQPPTPAAPSLSADDRALVDRAAAYLDGLGEAKGHFVQTDARGRTSEGSLYLHRPGKARFEYEQPPTLLVVADGFAVLVCDRRLKTFNRYPLGSTPLGLFLQKHVRLDKVDITAVDRVPGGFSITARGGGRGTRGQITLTFSDQPLALTQWSILDAQGARTTVRITGLEPTTGLDPGLFQSRKEACVG